MVDNEPFRMDSKPTDAGTLSEGKAVDAKTGTTSQPREGRDRSCGCCVGCALVSLALIAGTIYAAWALFDSDSPYNRASALSTTRAWARVEAFPVPESEIRVTTTGSMFSRQFIVEFEAKPADIRKWLAASPGLRGASPTTEPDGTRHYIIKPGGGAQSAELWVSADGRRIRIQAHWS